MESPSYQELLTGSRSANVRAPFRRASRRGRSPLNSRHGRQHFPFFIARTAKPPPNDSNHCCDRQSEINADKSANGSAHHQREYREKRVDVQLVSENARGDPVIDENPPDTQQRGHPYPMTVREDPEANDGGCGGYPSRDRNELQHTREDSQGQRVVVSQHE